jgi:hypothetical protein
MSGGAVLAISAAFSYLLIGLGNWVATFSKPQFPDVLDHLRQNGSSFAPHDLIMDATCL